MTHYNLASIPAAALNLVGCVNNAAWTAFTLGLTFPAQTLLFNPPSIQRRVVMGSSPSLTWNVTYRLTYKPCGWNSFWHVATNQFAEIQYNAGTQSSPNWQQYLQYTPASFSGL